MNFIAVASEALRRVELLLPHNHGRPKKTSGHKALISSIATVNKDVAKFQDACDELGIFRWSRTR